MATLDSTPEPVRIPLANNRGIVLVDAIDTDLLAFRWKILLPKTGGQYACRNTGGHQNNRAIYMHRLIMSRILGRELERGEIVDHKDGNGLNNCRDNLRLATKSTNSQNAKRRIDASSGFKGVTWNKAANRWQGQINVNGRHIYLGLFDTPEAAYAAYCKAAHEYFGDFARFE